MGEHAIGFHDLGRIARPHVGGGQHRIDGGAQHGHGLVQPGLFLQRIVGDRVRDHDARLVQPDAALGATLLPVPPRNMTGKRWRCGSCRPGCQKGAQFGHLGQHHGDDFQAVDLVLAELAGVAGLHHQHAELFAHALDRHAEIAGINLLAGLGHVAETGLGGGVGGVHMPPGAGDAADQPLAQAQPGLVHRFGLQPLGRAQLKRVGIAEKIDRADLGSHRIGDVMGDLVQTVLAAPGAAKVSRSRSSSLRESLSLRSGIILPLQPIGPDSGLFQFEGIMQRLNRQFHILAVDQHRNLDLAGGDHLDVDVFIGQCLNMRAATPAWLRMPMPTTETLATSVSTTRSS